MTKKWKAVACLAVSAAWFLHACHKGDGGGPVPSQTDSFAVYVQHGFGGGRYRAGDTVHIFSASFTNSQLFSEWTGNTDLLDAPDEWHTWFIMPRSDVSFTANLSSITPYALQFDRIMGANMLKPVYYYFPDDAKGIVYLLHGTGGHAGNIAREYEWQLVTRELVAGGYAVVITEAEESTLKDDVNGDGKIRWALLPADTLENVDYANIRIITDTLRRRGCADPAMPRYALGMSDGGFFADALSCMYGFMACVNYCSDGSDAVMQSTPVPTLFCMARFDSNPQVGQEGNAAALANAQALKKRGVCSGYLVKERSPLYRERFARNGLISGEVSAEVFDEIKKTGYLDNRNYFIGLLDDFVSAYEGDPARFPVINSLSGQQKVFVNSQIDLAISDHRMYSDFARATLRFMASPCP